MSDPKPVLLKPLPFVLLQVVLLSAAVTWVVLRVRAVEDEKQLPELRNVPVPITPLYNRPAVVSDADLQKVLHKLRPRLRGMRPRINHVDHALRFWGVQATFADPACLSGVEMRDILTDHRRFARLWRGKNRSLLTDTLYGVGTRVQEGEWTSSHVDHTVACLAEVGTPTDFPVITAKGETTFRAMIEHARRDFSLNQREYEWTAMLLALYMPTDRSWQTKEGQWISFDLLAERIMRQELTQGVCFGNHRLFTLALLLRVNEQATIFHPDMRAKVIAHLKGVTAKLVAHQDKAGFWDRNWDGGPWNDQWNEQAPRTRRILATGHTLEWWAIAPEDLLPPDHVVERAGQWLVKTILAMSDTEIRSGYTFLSHAGRALSLWRRKFPWQVYRRGES